MTPSSPSQAQMLAAVTEWICKAVPCSHNFLTDNRVRESDGGDKCMNCGEFVNGGKEECMKLSCMISIEDVLRAISEKEKFAAKETYISASGCFRENGRFLAQWALGKPLHEQSPELLAFLHSLIPNAQ